MTRWKAILFDADGTLLDYEQAQKKALNLTLSKYSGKDYGKEDLSRAYRLVNSSVFQDYEACRKKALPPSSMEFKKLFNSYGFETIDPAEFIENYFFKLALQGHILEGAVNVLRELSGIFRIALVSNGIGWVQRSRLNIADISGYFDSILLSCELDVAKPDPEIFRKAAELLQLEFSDLLFVGDSATSDLKGAENCGMDFAYLRYDINFSAPGPRVFELKNIKELPELIS